MSRPRPAFADLLLMPVLLAAAAAVWLLHADAYDLAGRTPVLDEQGAPVAVAARRLAQSGRLETKVAYPVELTRHGAPPWPLATLPPGPVLAQAAVQRIVPTDGRFGGSERRGALLLVLPFGAFLFLAGSLALVARHLFARWRPGGATWERIGAGAALSLAFALDPEAQHLAATSFVDLPAAIGLLFVLLGLALGVAADVPFVFGLMLGFAALFRTELFALAPVLAGLAAWIAADPARTGDHRPPVARALTTLVFALGGAVLVLAPWWVFKAREFGSFRWDPSTLVLWDGVGGRTALGLLHVAEPPALPGGFTAIGLLAGKALRMAPDLLLTLLAGPRAMWIAAIVLWLALVRPPRALAAAGLAALAALALELVWASLGLGWMRDLFAIRVLTEAAGLMAVWALVAHYTDEPAAGRTRVALWTVAAVLALAWGGWQTSAGLRQARVAAAVRPIPAPLSMFAANKRIMDRLATGEPVMSNLGATLAWYTNRPVIRLALTPADVPACRQRAGFRHVLLAFRDESQMWPGWLDVFARPNAASGVPGLRALSETRWTTSDGWSWLWLELPPLEPGVAELAPMPAGRTAPAPAGTGALARGAATHP